MLRLLVVILSISLVVGCAESSDNNTNANNSAGNNGSNTLEFLNLRVEELGSTRAVAKFETSIPTTCEVAYGTAEGALTLTAVDPDMVEGELSVTHTVPLEDLEPSTVYFWQGVVEDDTGAETRSETQSFTTSSGEGTELVNHALAATITAVSSNFGGGANDSSWGANNTIDGQMSTEWATAGDGDAASITMNLGESKNITHIGFRSRKMSDGTSIIEEFEVSFDGGDTLGPFASPDPDQRYEFELPQPVQATTMTLSATKTSGGNTGAKEIELLGPADQSACGVPESEVNFMTSDGVKLFADYWPAASADQGVVLLVHMIPPSWDRTSYPTRVRQALHDAGYSVLNIDRRGAGDSTEGSPNAEDAYTGDTARLDVEAAVQFLSDADCSANMNKMMIVGASNGTTSVMDYTVNPSIEGLPLPAAIVWLSPGSYTENQNALADHAGTMDTLPLLMIYPDNEPWADGYVANTPAAWDLLKLTNGNHGTQNFDDGELEAQQLPAILNWADAHISN